MPPACSIRPRDGPGCRPVIAPWSDVLGDVTCDRRSAASAYARRRQCGARDPGAVVIPPPRFTRVRTINRPSVSSRRTETRVALHMLVPPRRCVFRAAAW